MKEKIKSLPFFSALLAILACVQFIMLVIINYTKMYGFLDYDSSLTIRHAVEMWKNGLFLKDWAYASTLELDCAAFFAAPIYMATGRLNVAMTIVHIILYGFVVTILYNISIYLHATFQQYLFIIILFFTPYTFGMLEWANMLFISAGPYEFRVLTLLLLINILLICNAENISKKRFVFWLLIFESINFWTSLSVGNYALLMIIFPFVLWIIIETIYHQKVKILTIRNIVIIVSCFISLLGWMIHNHYVGALHRSNLSLIPADKFIQNIQNAIEGVFVLFGGLTRATDISVLSIRGIIIMVSFLFVCSCISVILLKCKSSEKNPVILNMFLVYAFVNLSVLFLTNSSYGNDLFEHRYHILWCSMMLVVVGFFVIDATICKNRFANKCYMYGVVLLVLIINISGFYKLSLLDGQKEFAKSIIEAADEKKANSIFIYEDFITAHVIRALDINKYCIALSIDDSECNMDVLDMYSFYGENVIAEGKNLFICRQDDFDNIPEYIRLRYKLVKKMEYDTCIYYASDNPWDGFSGLPTGNNGNYRAVDFPYSKGFIYNGSLSENGTLIAEVMEQDGHVLWGPYTKPIAGTYDITCSYNVIKSGSSEAKFETVMNNGTLMVANGALKDTKRSLTLSNVCISKGENIEFRIWKPKDAIIEIESITYEIVQATN